MCSERSGPFEIPVSRRVPCGQPKGESRMASTLITVRDHVGWGKLVKSWALGVNLLRPGSPPPPIPRDLAEFRRICIEDYEIDMDIPESLGFAVMQPGENTFVLKLPPKDKLQESHGTLGSRESY